MIFIFLEVKSSETSLLVIIIETFWINYFPIQIIKVFFKQSFSVYFWEVGYQTLKSSIKARCNNPFMHEESTCVMRAMDTYIKAV